MAGEKYILDEDGQPSRCDDIHKWAAWHRSNQDRVQMACHRVNRPNCLSGAPVIVSTVFLPFDHNFSGQGDPVLWETVVFGGKLNRDGERYQSTTEALDGHMRWLERVRVAEGS